ncbi:MAG: helix-turn-helix domain-containing protein [Chloroflexota bacterium]|nr:helix-turn-helix domain-containing protein [Chloroflexota bacterium]
MLERVGHATMLARVGQGLSQRRLAALCSVDQSTICRLENGLAPGLRLDKLAKIIAVLGVDRFDHLRPIIPPRAGEPPPPSGVSGG